MKLVPIDSIRPSTYNPRQSDPRRLDLIELSLRKLGFIHPIFCDANGPLDASIFEGLGIRRSEFFRFGEFIGWILYKSGS